MSHAQGGTKSNYLATPKSKSIISEIPQSAIGPMLIETWYGVPPQDDRQMRHAQGGTKNNYLATQKAKSEILEI